MLREVVAYDKDKVPHEVMIDDGAVFDEGSDWKVFLTEEEDAFVLFKPTTGAFELRTFEQASIWNRFDRAREFAREALDRDQ